MLYVVTSMSLNLLWFACRKNLLPSERFLWSFGVPGKRTSIAIDFRHIIQESTLHVETAHPHLFVC